MRRLIPALIAAAALAGCTPPADPGAPTPGSTPFTAANVPANAPSADPPPPAVSGTVTIGMMPKKKGIPYFNACETGAHEAAKELSADVKLTYEGPTEDRSEDQTLLVNTWVTRQFNAIAVACNDPDQIAAALSAARDQGIHTLTWDADANPQSSRRQFFVNQAGVEDLAQKLVEEMVKQVGEDAKLGVISSSSTAPNQTAWLAAMDRYMKEKHPKLTIVNTEYAGEQQSQAVDKTKALLKAYPEVKGIWAMTSVAFPGAAQAVQEAGAKGKVAVLGLSTPNDMRPFVKSGVVKSVVLWNPVDLGYLTVHVARALAKGELKRGDATFKAGRLGELNVQDDVVLLGEPKVFTPENIDEFKF